MKLPKCEEIEDPPCDTCKLYSTCEEECIVFSHWTDTGKVLRNIFSSLQQGKCDV